MPPVKKVQEWLTLHDFVVTVDGVGPATEKALKGLQAQAGTNK